MTTGRHDPEIDWLNQVVTRHAGEPTVAIYEHEAGDTGTWYQAIARRITGQADDVGGSTP